MSQEGLGFGVWGLWSLGHFGFRVDIWFQAQKVLKGWGSILPHFVAGHFWNTLKLKSKPCTLNLWGCIGPPMKYESLTLSCEVVYGRSWNSYELSLDPSKIFQGKSNDDAKHSARLSAL